MKKVVAIGGGKIEKFETLRIDREIIKLCKKDSPKILYIPTAGGDPEYFCNIFRKFKIWQYRSRNRR